jgi:hypothetical protein
MLILHSVVRMTWLPEHATMKSLRQVVPSIRVQMTLGATSKRTDPYLSMTRCKCSNASLTRVKATYKQEQSLDNPVRVIRPTKVTSAMK